MKNYNSVLKFNNYIVNKVEFLNNSNFKANKNGTPINFEIEKPEIEINKNLMNITLQVKLFENAQENNYPFEMSISLTGYFETEGDKPNKFIPNAIAIMYPYIRAIVSTYTASANVNPLILPAININKLIEETQKEKD